MEDLFYILAGVAYLAYSIYSANQKSKKKKQQEASQQRYEEPKEMPAVEPVPQEDFTTSIFDEILGVQDMNSTIEEEILGKQKTQPVMTETPLDAVPKEEGVRTTKTKSKIKEIKTDPHSPIVSGDLTLEEDVNEIDFDLRQAVIASEILNPPYIER